MSITDLFWIFLIIAFVLPAFRKWMLDTRRVRLMHQIEQKRGSRVISLIHRQETLSLLGLPLRRYIDINDSEQVLRAIKLTDPNVPIDMILHTPGGMVLASEQIARALCRHKAKVTVFVPHYAMSGGTLIAMAAQEIVMDENAVLGPVDPQVGQYPAISILNVVENKAINEVDDQTLIMADISRKAMRQVRTTIQEILSESSMDEEQARQLAETISGGVWTHDYPIQVEVARSLGLNVTTDLPRDIYTLMELYPQAQARRPSVDYIPMPYRERPSEESRPRG